MKRKAQLTEHIHIRCTPREKNTIEGLAGLYAEGNLSLWLVHAGIEAPRKYLKRDSIRDTTRGFSRKKKK